MTATNDNQKDESPMGRLIVSAQMTTDAVIDQMEGWFDPDSESEQDGLEELRAADCLILGRETYEHFSTFWPSQSGGYADLVNPLPKYVASRTLKEPLSWNAPLLSGDIAVAVSTLKQQNAGTLLSYGCGELAGHLAQHGLIDEVRLWTHPVVWGHGVRPFHASALPVRLRLIGATTYTAGVIRAAYQPLPMSA